MNFLKKLPETVPYEELAVYFKLVIDEFEINKSMSVEEMMDAFEELADKQWHNYRLMDADLRTYLDIYISGKIKSIKFSPDLIGQIAHIIGNIGLVNSYEHFKKLKDSNTLKEEERKLAEEIVDEFGDSVEDPYSDFWGKGKGLKLT